MHAKIRHPIPTRSQRGLRDLFEQAPADRTATSHRIRKAVRMKDVQASAADYRMAPVTPTAAARDPEGGYLGKTVVISGDQRHFSIFVQAV